MATAQSNRATVIDAIRSALNGSHRNGLPDNVTPVSAPSTEFLIRQFIDNATAVGSQVAVATTPAAAVQLVRQWLDEAHTTECIYVPTPLMEKLGLCRAAFPEFKPLPNWDQDAARSLLLNAAIGLNESTAGISSTGTLVEISGSDKSRLVSLLPRIHVSILPVEHIYADLFAWLNRSYVAAGEWLRSSMTLITGPSRSADIEQTLTKGVHGPIRVCVLLVDF